MSVCTGEGKSYGEFSTRMVVCASQWVFFSMKERRKEGEQERLFSFGIWILGHTGPGVSQSGQSEGGG